jgi:hypothetical protein
MATKKKSKKKSSKKTKAPKRKVAKKRAARTTVVSSRKSVAQKAGRAKKAAPGSRVRGKSPTVDTVAYEPAGLGARSGGQSGDLQGLSNRGRASSESVDELLEEGNAFEAEIVKGVEDVADEEEVRTHEVPTDDVRGEYLDED